MNIEIPVQAEPVEALRQARPELSRRAQGERIQVEECRLNRRWQMGVDSRASNPKADVVDLRDVLGLMRDGNWRAAHDQVQLDATELGAWLHGLLHVQEGDLEDAEYWFGRAGRSFRGRKTLDEELALLETQIQDVYRAALPSSGSA